VGRKLPVLSYPTPACIFLQTLQKSKRPQFFGLASGFRMTGFLASFPVCVSVGLCTLCTFQLCLIKEKHWAESCLFCPPNPASDTPKIHKVFCITSGFRMASCPVCVSVWGCVYTRELYLHNNRLSVISKDAFTNLASLQVTP
jgi:hypothetical protein